MTRPPPPPSPPGPVFQRVLSVSRANGWGVAAVAGLSLAASLVSQDWTGAAWCGLAVLAGVIELTGRHKLRAGDAGGLLGLVGAQFVLLGVIWAYAWFRWRFFEPDDTWALVPRFLQEHLLGQFKAAGLDPDRELPVMLRLVNAATCGALAVTAVLYQGGLAFYYVRRRAAIRAALAPVPPPISP